MKFNLMTFIQAFAPPPLRQGSASLRVHLALVITLQGRQLPASQVMSRMLMAYIAMSDKAAREYDSGCKKVDDHMHGRGESVTLYMEAVGSFENCINSVKRASRAFDRLVTRKDGLSLDRTLRERFRRYESRVTELRNAIEHIDQEIDGLQEGESHLLTITQDGSDFEIGAHKISVAYLGAAVTLLYEIGEAIVNTLPYLEMVSELHPKTPICRPEGKLRENFN